MSVSVARAGEGLNPRLRPSQDPGGIAPTWYSDDLPERRSGARGDVRSFRSYFFEGFFSVLLFMADFMDADAFRRFRCHKHSDWVQVGQGRTSEGVF